jgi:hypothetical protein
MALKIDKTLFAKPHMLSPTSVRVLNQTQHNEIDRILQAQEIVKTATSGGNQSDQMIGGAVQANLKPTLMQTT